MARAAKDLYSTVMSSKAVAIPARMQILRCSRAWPSAQNDAHLMFLIVFCKRTPFSAVRHPEQACAMERAAKDLLSTVTVFESSCPPSAHADSSRLARLSVAQNEAHLMLLLVSCERTRFFAVRHPEQERANARAAKDLYSTVTVFESSCPSSALADSSRPRAVPSAQNDARK